MKHPRVLALLLLCLFAPLLRAQVPATNTEPQLVVQAQDPSGEFEYDLATGVATAERGVIVRYGEATLTARRVTLDRARSRVFAEGDVRLTRDGALWVGDSVTYDFKNRVLDADMIRTGNAPVFAAGQVAHTDQIRNSHTIHDALITTDDYAQPGQYLRAKSITLIPGEHLEARNATLYLGRTPVFYFPYYRRSLKRHPNNFQFTPGYRSLYGPYLLSTYEWYASEKLGGQIHLDYRQKRGLAGGPDVNYHLGQWGDGQIGYYFARDERPGLDPARTPIPDQRHRVSWEHLARIESNLTVRAAVRYQSDAFFQRDYFEHLHRENVQPSSFFEVNKTWDNFALDALVQPRLVEAYETVERLPDVKLTGFRQQLGETPLYYESESDAGWFRRKFAGNIRPDYSAWRGDTYHQLSLHRSLFGWLNVTPRLGGRLTAYSAASGNGAATTEQTRGLFNTGAEISTKASRVSTTWKSRLLAADGLRHIIEPSINYVYVPTPAARPPQLPQFDYELQSYRLLPLDFPDYNAVDSVDGQSTFRLGLRNKFQTRRDGSVENLLHWAFYADWRLHPRLGQPTWSDAFSEFDFSPRTWLHLGQQARYDMTGNHWREINHTLTLAPGFTWSWAGGNRFLRDVPNLGPNTEQNLWFSNFYWRWNHNWAFRASHHFEARDGRMEEQFYTLYRDLRSWTAALTFRVRANRAGPDDFSVALTFSLKAFPRFRTGQDSSSPSLLLGG